MIFCGILLGQRRDVRNCNVGCRHVLASRILKGWGVLLTCTGKPYSEGVRCAVDMYCKAVQWKGEVCYRHVLASCIVKGWGVLLTCTASETVRCTVDIYWQAV
jgi:hypothetical protein